MRSWQLQGRVPAWNLPERTWRQEGQGWPRGGKGGKRSTRLWITTLSWEQCEAPDTCCAAGEAGWRQAQRVVQGHTVPKGYSTTITSPQLALPVANSPLRGLRRHPEHPQPAFLLPHACLLSAFGIPSATLHDSPSVDPTRPRRSSTVNYRDKGRWPNPRKKWLGNSAVLLSPRPQQAQSWFVQCRVCQPCNCLPEREDDNF